jgi:hypothetical protein
LAPSGPAFGDSEVIGIGVDPAAAGADVLYQSATGIRTPRDAVAIGASPRLAIGRGTTFAVWRDAAHAIGVSFGTGRPGRDRTPRSGDEPWRSRSQWCRAAHGVDARPAAASARVRDAVGLAERGR